MSARAAALAAAALLPALAGPPPAAAAGEAAVRSVTVDGTRFVVTLADGTVLPQERLPGTILMIGDGTGARRPVRIDTVETDARDPKGEVILYGLSQQAADGGWTNLCDPDPDGRRLGFPLQGAFTPDGRHVEAPGRFFVTCTGGAEGKCVRFGYKPWGTAPDGSPMEPYYQACVAHGPGRLLRRWGGHTKNGTPIDLFDRIGVQKDEPVEGITLRGGVRAARGGVRAAHPLARVARPRRARGAVSPAGGTPRRAVRRGRAGAALRQVLPALTGIGDGEPRAAGLVGDGDVGLVAVGQRDADRLVVLVVLPHLVDGERRHQLGVARGGAQPVGVGDHAERVVLALAHRADDGVAERAVDAAQGLVEALGEVEEAGVRGAAGPPAPRVLWAVRSTRLPKIQPSSPVRRTRTPYQLPSWRSSISWSPWPSWVRTLSLSEGPARRFALSEVTW